ncbi:MAG: hypothetical protein RDV48_16170 [Candidatus Eremiobacteraeota bacterium]|nr:hypothetical protein [Candidatus Eremiobacteraeota bacterium]
MRFYHTLITSACMIFILSLLSTGKALALPAGSPPVLQGEISGFVQNEKNKVIAVTADQRAGDMRRTALIFFDWGALRIMSSTTVDCSLHNLSWSPDGSTLAAIGEKQGIMLFTAKGECRRLSTLLPVRQFRWSTKKPSTIYYITNEKSDRVMELSTATGKERQIRKADDLISIFEVKGSMWYARRVRTDKPQDFYGDVEACDIATGSRRFFLPFYGRAWDYRYLEVSPCGKYFFFSGMASAGTLNVVARREDAPLIFKKPYLSIMFQYGFEDLYSILWPGIDRVRSQYHEDDAVVQPGDEPSFFLDLSSGSRGKIAEIPYSKSDGVFLLTSEGLVMKEPSNETKLILRGKMGKQ